jgi:hypothetical protein
MTGGQMRGFAQRLRDAMPRPLTEEQILAWADAHYARTGEWPKSDSGGVTNAPGEIWARIHDALSQGHRGLPGGSSLARLLAERRGVRNQKGLSSLTTEQVLSWADAYFETVGRWPTPKSGSIPHTSGETWAAVQAALSQGGRGLPGRSSLARLLAEHRGVRNLRDVPHLTIEKILAWADTHHQRTGEWPTQGTGAILDSGGETWKGVQMALLKGQRGLPGGSSIARLLAQERGVKHPREATPLTEREILSWADQHFEHTGRWPTADAGPASTDSEITWRVIEDALRKGQRGLPGGSSVARLLAERRGVRNRSALALLSLEQILSWADAHFARTGRWPNADSGSVGDAAGETWRNLNAALLQGLRGLPGNCSLAQLLEEHRGRRNHKTLPPLTVEQVLNWADAHHRRTGQWPKSNSGPVTEHPGDVWQNVNQAMIKGLRGLPGGFSLAQLLAKERGVRSRSALPPLTIEQILTWVDSHHEQTGKWPKPNTGRVRGASDETWSGINTALIRGRRGLEGGSSLATLLQERRGVRNKRALPCITVEQILGWADAYHDRTGTWPSSSSGPIPEAPGETWSGIHAALPRGLRGLPGDSSLPQLLAKHRGVRNRMAIPNLTAEQILTWAEAYRKRIGKWPGVATGPVLDAPGETWRNIDDALRRGTRGLPGESSLARLITDHCFHSRQ